MEVSADNNEYRLGELIKWGNTYCTVTLCVSEVKNVANNQVKRDNLGMQLIGRIHRWPAHWILSMSPAYYASPIRRSGVKWLIS